MSKTLEQVTLTNRVTVHPPPRVILSVAKNLIVRGLCATMQRFFTTLRFVQNDSRGGDGLLPNRIASGLMLLVGIVLICGGAYSAEPKALATQIVDATGVKGGLIVHLGCGDGRLTAALRLNDSYLVHGLDADAVNVESARKHIQSLGLYGQASVDWLRGQRLPYVENMVNLLVAEKLGNVPMGEVMRVLAPNGVAYVKKGGQWAKTVKPRPKEIDEWTHYLRDASNNAVARDSVVGPPRRVQWVGSPRWARHHDHMASMSALVSANGRIFYIFDEGPTSSIQLPPRWVLIARDAFNGVILWKRDMGPWNTHRWPLKSGPAQLPRRLVAVGDRVYVTLALDAPLTAIDAATGKTLRTYADTKNAEEVIASEGVLFVLASDSPSKWPEFRQKDAYVWDNTGRANREWVWDEQKRRIMAVQADSGKVLWQAVSPVAPLTLAADRERLLFHDGEKVVCLNRADGKELWHSQPVKRRSPMPVSFGPSLVVHQDVVVFAGGNRSMAALAVADGKVLWTGKHHRGGHMSPEDLLIVGGLVWSGDVAGGSDSGVFTGRDLHTGEVKSEFTPDVKTYWFHHRCYRAKATERYLLPSRTGIEFVDFRNKHWEPHHWVRGGCIYGIMPCNGMVYAPPHSCGCYLESKLNGFNALAPASAAAPAPEDVADEGRLERGPAYGEATENPEPKIENAEDWPTYRCDAARSGATKASVPLDLTRAWQADVGGKLSSVVISGGKLFVASVDNHTVHALDASTGKALWTYTAGGRVDSPPTIYQGRVLFGSADGWVYCLRASDGKLAWRFLGGPHDRRAMAFEQLESVWPVHGSVLVQGGVVYCVAGRSMFLDGGMRLLRLDPKTGRKISETILDDRDPETGKNLQVHVKGLDMPVTLPDVLSSDGRFVYMRSQRFDLEGKRQQIAPLGVSEQAGEGAHLFCQIGFLDDSWFHRSYWLFGRCVAGGYGGWYQAARLVPAGRLLVFDESHVYGYGRKPQYVCNASVLEYQLFAAEKAAKADAILRVRRANGPINLRSRRRSANSSDWKLRRGFSTKELSAVEFKWANDQPSVQARAMALADKTLFIAGPPDVIDERRSFRLPDDEEVQAKLADQLAALEAGHGARLWAVSALDGKPLARYKLDALPVFDGMAAAGGRLFLATTGGKVICLGAESGDALARADGEPLQTVSDEPPEPEYLEPLPEPRDKDFAHVQDCRVFASKLGYRIMAKAKGKTALAVNKLDVPLTGKAVLEVKLKSVSASGFLINGFLAFGDGPSDDQLVKCGIRLQAQVALIIQGPLKRGKAAGRKLAVNRNKLQNLTVAVDLDAQKVTLTTGKVTVEAKLARRIDAITHLGYSVDSAITDFSAIKTSAGL